MFLLILVSLILFVIFFLMMMMASLLSKKMNYNREKNSPFECGFDPMNSARLPFSLRFFLITIIFLIFDVEIVLLFPIIKIMKFSEPLVWICSSMIFILILIVGLYYEWSQGSLEWSK